MAKIDPKIQDLANKTDAVTVSGTLTEPFIEYDLSGALKVNTSNTAGGIRLGADFPGPFGITDGVFKIGTMSTPHLSSASEQNVAILNMEASSDNTLSIGGGSGTMNACTVVRFYTGSGNATLVGTERMRIDSVGNVGIGANNPTASFTGKVLEIFENSSNGAGLRLSNTDGFGEIQGNNNALFYDANQHFFRGQGGGTAHVEISSNGDLGLGRNASAGTRFALRGTGTTTATNVMVAQTGGPVNAFIIRDSAAVLTNSGNIDGTTSDVRLKENIVPISGALSVIAALNPVQFDWKSPEHHLASSQAGFIAQEVQVVRPDWVQEGAAPDAEMSAHIAVEDTDPVLTTRFIDLQAYMVKAIQELKADNDAKQVQIDDLLTRVAALEV